MRNFINWLFSDVKSLEEPESSAKFGPSGNNINRIAGKLTDKNDDQFNNNVL